MSLHVRGYRGYSIISDYENYFTVQNVYYLWVLYNTFYLGKYPFKCYIRGNPVEVFRLVDVWLVGYYLEVFNELHSMKSSDKYYISISKHTLLIFKAIVKKRITGLVINSTSKPVSLFTICV